MDRQEVIEIVVSFNGEDCTEENLTAMLEILELAENDWSRNAAGQCWQDCSVNGGILDPTTLLDYMGL